MNPDVLERTRRQVDQLVREGRQTLSALTSRSDASADPRLYSKWFASCRGFVAGLGPAANIWAEALAKDGRNIRDVALSHLGTMESLLEAIEGGLLRRVEDLITADAFGELLEQADELLGKGYALAAGVLGRAVLEEHLRKLCNRHNCLPAGRPTINDLNASLYKSGRVDKLTMQQVTAFATAGNHCAHNNEPPLPATDVRRFLDDVRDFLLRHPLP